MKLRSARAHLPWDRRSCEGKLRVCAIWVGCVFQGFPPQSELRIYRSSNKKIPIILPDDVRERTFDSIFIILIHMHAQRENTVLVGTALVKCVQMNLVSVHDDLSFMF